MLVHGTCHVAAAQPIFNTRGAVDMAARGAHRLADREEADRAFFLQQIEAVRESCNEIGDVLEVSVGLLKAGVGLLEELVPGCQVAEEVV